MAASLTFFPVGNGDMTLITFDNDQKLLIDLNVRQAADDDDDDETPDVMSDLRERLSRDDSNRLFVDGFLLSHPDKDHITGLEEHFYLGKLEDWDEDDDKIVIREMWSSPIVFRRAGKNLKLCPDAKAWAKEARRRVKLFREDEVEEGDRIQILGEDEDGKTDDILDIVVKINDTIDTLDDKSSSAFEARLLGPLATGDDEDEEDRLAKNRSSVIIRFSLMGDGVSDQCRFLTAGDAEVAVWERLWGDHGSENSDWLSYDVLQAPHHCSWHSLSHDSYSEMGEDAQVSDDARSALSQTRYGAIVIASSKAIDPEDSDPPSDRAKREYVSIVDDNSDRFFCVQDVWEDEEQALEYKISFSGTTKKTKTAAKAAASVLGIGATAQQARAHGKK